MLKKIRICCLLFAISWTGFWIILTAESPDGSLHYRYTCSLPENDLGYWLVPKEYLEDLDVASQPSLFGDRHLRFFATPGEYEPVTFVIYATAPLNEVKIEISPLKGGERVIPPENMTLRIVLRSPERRVYWGPPSENVVTSRILDAYRPFNLSAGELRELWITVHVPSDLPAGSFQGNVTVRPSNQLASQINLSLEVLPFKLKRHPRKRFGVHYSVSNLKENREKVLLELQDMKDHGADFVFSTSRIDYSTVDNVETPNFDELRMFLSLMQQSGCENGPISVETGFEELALAWSGRSKSQLEEDEALYLDLARAIDERKPFHGLAREALEGLKRIEKEYPNYDFYLTHMDEVFNSGRLPLYIALTKIVRELSDFQMHMSIHHGEGTETMRRQIDPYIDLRVHHGYSFEQWLTRNHSIDQYREELEDSGDLSWQYHNRIGAFIAPKWQRLINGIYMWIAPFDGRYDWTYQHCYGDPFNDLDGEQGIRYDDYSWSYPSPEDGKTPTPTRSWEAWREGIDDLSYFYTLQELIRRCQEREGIDGVESAEKWLQYVAGWFPEPSGLTSGERGTPEESPIIHFMDQRLSAESLQQTRYTTAMHIIGLVQQLN